MSQRYYDMLNWGDQLKHVNRYQLTPDQIGFVETAVDYIRARPHEISGGDTLYRARKHAVDQDSPYPLEEMGSPPPHLQSDGRCSPRGIPCLYLASDPETAVAEVRPWAEARVTVSDFTLVRDVRLADVRGVAHRPEFQKLAEPDAPPIRESIGAIATMLFLSKSFSRPGHEQDSLAYVPTQFVSGLLMAEGFDGLIYSSLMRASGFNVALFDPASASAVSADLYRVDRVIYCSRKLAPPDDRPTSDAVTDEQHAAFNDNTHEN